jgi:hypothetical protein
MKAIFTEGSIHHLKTMEVQAVPRIGETVIVDNKTWTVEEVTHFPKQNGRNDNENCCGWDDDRDADLSVHLAQDDGV